MIPQEAKVMLKSKAFWGVAVAFVAQLLKMFGVIELTDVDQQALLTGIENITILGGILVALWGRATAKGPLKLMSTILPLFLLGMLMGGCSLLPYGPQVKAISDQAAVAGVADRKEFNDKRLTISLAAVCDNSIGSYLRLDSSEIKEAIFTICGGSGQGITAERLANLLNTLDDLQPEPKVP